MGGSRRRVDLLSDLKFTMVRTGGNATLIKGLMVKRIFRLWSLLHCTKKKFSIKDFFSKCNQIRSFLRIWSHILKKYLIENFFFLQCPHKHLHF